MLSLLLLLCCVCMCTCVVERLANTGRRGYQQQQLIRQPHVIIEEETSGGAALGSPTESVNKHSLSVHSSSLSTETPDSTDDALLNVAHVKQSGEPRTFLNHLYGVVFPFYFANRK